MTALDDTPAGPAEAGQVAAPDEAVGARGLLRALLRNRLAAAALVVLATFVVVAVLGERLAPYGRNEVSSADKLRGPSLDHLFGTDQLGRDVFSRVLIGAEPSLRVGLVAVGIALVAGVVLGLVAGYYRGLVDDVVMRCMDVLFAFPAILLAIASWPSGGGATNAMIAIGIVYPPIFARVTRASVQSVREQVFVRAARSIGAGDLRIMTRHVLPNVAAPIIVQTSISLAFAILAEAALSFIGLGTQPPEPSWGRMLADGRGFIQDAWWMAVFPAWPSSPSSCRST